VARLGADIMAAIGRQLRLMYAEIVAQGVPEHFAEILRRLDEPSNEGSKNEPTPPAAPSAASQHVNRDDGLQNASEVHESHALARSNRARSHCSPATARGLIEVLMLALGFTRDMLAGLVLVGLATAEPEINPFMCSKVR